MTAGESTGPAGAAAGAAAVTGVVTARTAAAYHFGIGRGCAAGGIAVAIGNPEMDPLP